MCTASLLHFAEIVDATEMYPYAAVILLPINSSLNPLLYSDAVDIAWNALSNCLVRQPALKPLTDRVEQVIQCINSNAIKACLSMAHLC